MKFIDVLNDIEQLIGKPLEAINPQTNSIEIVSVVHKTQNLLVKIGTGKAKSRPFSQLEKIWENLLHNRVADIETILGGSGSSRHIPETIFANLPYVEYFKYNRKKHLFLNTESSHELGTIKQVETSDIRKIKFKLDNSNKFDHFLFSTSFNNALGILDEAIKELQIKFPGDFKAAKISDAKAELIKLSLKLDNTFLTPIENETENYIETLSAKNETINLDSPEIIGYDGGDYNTIDGDDNSEDEEELSASRIRFTPTTVSLIYDRLLYEEIELQPDFQRKGRIWSLHNKSALIESILIGLPIPTFYFAERPDGKWVIVDGLQRITTFYDFISNKFKLKDLKFLKKLNTLTFEDLPRPDQRKIREYQLHCHIITITKDSDKMVRELFQRINTYGVKMSFQEIRCALYPGSSVKFIRYMAENDIFQNATFGKVQPKRMKDMELVLGAVAFTLFGFKNFNENKFDTFLTRCMQKLNVRKLHIHWPEIGYIDTDSQDQKKKPVWYDENTDLLYITLKDKINSALILAERVFGQDRFKKGINGKVINKPLFELIVSTFSLLSEKDQSLLLEQKNRVKKELYELLNGRKQGYVDWDSEQYSERNFEYSVSQSTGKRITIQYRFRNFQALLEDILGKKISLKGLIHGDD